MSFNPVTASPLSALSDKAIIDLLELAPERMNQYTTQMEVGTWQISWVLYQRFV